MSSTDVAKLRKYRSSEIPQHYISGQLFPADTFSVTQEFFQLRLPRRRIQRASPLRAILDQDRATEARIVSCDEKNAAVSFYR